MAGVGGGGPPPAVTVTANCDWLFASLLSAASLLTLAALVFVPTWLSLTTSVTVAPVPGASEPSGHLNGADPLHVPCDGTADTSVEPGGGVSCTTTPDAPSGPLFDTFSV